MSWRSTARMPTISTCQASADGTNAVNMIRANDCLKRPWKNGGGYTTEIAIEPATASLDDFDWRVSMAHVASDGPFSDFADVDRTLTIVRGGGLALTIGDAPPVLLGAGSDPLGFPGDVPTYARLCEGDVVVDLNVMTRRRRFDHQVHRIRSPAHCDFDGFDMAVVVACNGSIALDFDHKSLSLSGGDASIFVRAADPPFRIVPAASADCCLILLRRQSGPDQPG
jgi:uncharacterized protein